MYIKRIITSSVDGLVIDSQVLEKSCIDYIVGCNIPTIVITNKETDKQFKTNIIDAGTYQGMISALEFLSKNDRDRIILIDFPTNSDIGKTYRRQAFEDYTLEKKLSDFKIVEVGDTSSLSVIDELEALIESERFNAIVTSNDHLGLFAYNFCVQRGLKPGKDIYLVCFDDSNISSMLGISSVKIDLDGMAKYIISNLIDDNKSGTMSKSFSTELIHRTTTLEGDVEK